MLANFTYTYDLASRMTSQTIDASTTSYSYDANSELTTAGSTNYSYDLNGNRTMTGYTTGSDNQITSDGTWTYSYDNEGNLIKKTKGASAETWTYGYDNLNRMIWAKDSATDGGTVLSVATYVYDVFGNRVEEDIWTQSSGTTTVSRFAYDGQEVWADLNGSNALVTRYLRGDNVDQLFARISAAGTAAWYLTDFEGSVMNLTENSGNVQDTISYDAFGNVTSESNPSFGDRYKYTGRELDPETGFQYNRAHYYDAAIGSWTSQDPLGFAAGDANLYRYVGNSPTNATDPLGLLRYVDPEGAGGSGAGAPSPDKSGSDAGSGGQAPPTSAPPPAQSPSAQGPQPITDPDPQCHFPAQRPPTPMVVVITNKAPEQEEEFWRKKYPQAAVIGGVKDINDMLRRLRESDLHGIRRLIIAGHGGPMGSVAVDGDQPPIGASTIVGTSALELRVRMGHYFPIIVISACGQGRWPNQLQQLADNTGCVVIAPKGDCGGAGMPGWQDSPEGHVTIFPKGSSK